MPDPTSPRTASPDPVAPDPPPAVRAVLDTNVLVAGLRSGGGASAAIL